MINELHALGRSMEKNGISIPVKYPWVKGIKKGEALLVNITGGGVVDSLEYCSPEQVKTFWNIEASNKATFPKINVDPLWVNAEQTELLKTITEAGSKKDWEQWFCGLNELLESNSVLCCKKIPKKSLDWKRDKWSRLYKFPHESILPYLSDDNAGLSELIHCFDPFETFDEQTIDRLFIQVSRMLVANLKNGSLECFKLAEDLLVGKPGTKKQPQVTLIFNHSRQKMLVADSSEANALCKALLSSGGGKKTHLCPLTGVMEEEVSPKFPCPNLPVLGKTYLMSMNKDAPCHSRYGKFAANIFPASSESTSRLDNVLRYITDADRQAKTWMAVASGKWEGNPKKEKRDLLICYAEEIPALQNEGLAFLMGGDAGSEQRFESVSSLVCDALRKNKATETSSKIRLFVIRRISKGQSQVVLNDFCSTTELFKAVESWGRAAKNHPPYALYLPQKTGGKPMLTEPPVPFPADLIRLLQYQWIRAGTESSKLAGCSLDSAYDLFIDRGSRTQATAQQALRLILQRMLPLLIGIGWSGKSTDFEFLNKYPPDAKRSTLLAIAFVGIILFKLGYTKEKYMKDAGYNIGRLLSLADCLHKEYCRFVRKGGIPNQLLGNALLQTVLDNPVRGLARLSERIAVYTAWVSRAHGDEYKLAGWAKSQMGIISEQLAGGTLPDSTDDVLKAQILLGYLAHAETKQENNNKGENHE